MRAQWVLPSNFTSPADSSCLPSLPAPDPATPLTSPKASPPSSRVAARRGWPGRQATQTVRSPARAHWTLLTLPRPAPPARRPADWSTGRPATPPTPLIPASSPTAAPPPARCPRTPAGTLVAGRTPSSGAAVTDSPWIAGPVWRRSSRGGRWSGRATAAGSTQAPATPWPPAHTASPARSTQPSQQQVRVTQFTWRLYVFCGRLGLRIKPARGTVHLSCKCVLSWNIRWRPYSHVHKGS